MPAHAAWYRYNCIHPVERNALPDFFQSSGSSTSKARVRKRGPCHAPQTVIRFENERVPPPTAGGSCLSSVLIPREHVGKRLLPVLATAKQQGVHQNRQSLCVGI